MSPSTLFANLYHRHPASRLQNLFVNFKHQKFRIDPQKNLDLAFNIFPLSSFVRPPVMDIYLYSDG
jgi:hypothetical protein